MKTFNDLVFEPHKATLNEQAKKDLIASGMNPDSDIFNEMLQCKIEFNNGIRLSVIFGKMFYSNGVDTYEAMEIGSNEPKGYLSKDEVTEYMKELQES